MAINKENPHSASVYSIAAWWRPVRYAHITEITGNSSSDQVLVSRAAIDCVLLHAAGGFIRVFLTDGSLENSFAISLSLFLIVTSSVLIGTMLPFGLAKAGVDPANAGTSVQVRCSCLCDGMAVMH